MHLFQILVLAIVQGAAELLPVSSSAHVIVAEKLMGLDATSPEMTFLLVMLHTGTMFAVIAYFWSAWRRAFFGSALQLRASLVRVVLATGVTGVVGLALLQVIKHVVAGGRADYEIEQLFGDARVMTGGLVAAGLLILVASRRADRPVRDISLRQAGWIGAIQGLCLPFRGFSRSGATISAGMLLGAARQRAEEFSFALAVALTPPVVAREAWRLLKNQALAAQPCGVAHLLAPGLTGMVFSFLAGLLALRWLSRWLEQGRWHWFGIYCLLAAAVVWRVG
ncbi:MAG: undecaprenyl-diphosphate phosphatase [Burkholderiales bacterium]|nr:undecaprenyl-diphosphate phosphatase [Burkholderiales bacterium]